MKYNEKLIPSHFIGLFFKIIFLFLFFLSPLLPLCRTESPSSAISKLALSVLHGWSMLRLWLSLLVISQSYGISSFGL